ncbi:hypothetical protein D3C80_1262380 [compost metagenome]
MQMHTISTYQQLLTGALEMIFTMLAKLSIQQQQEVLQTVNTAICCQAWATVQDGQMLIRVRVN